MILGHRLSELCGHGPSLETDIALTNISLDLFGQVRNYFRYAAEIKGKDATEDSIAFLRYDRDYRNVLLVEQPNKDFAHVIGRQFLFDSFHKPLLESLTKSTDGTIAAIASKSIKEALYHLRFSSEWVKRLGAGTDESHIRMQHAVNELYPFVSELYNESDLEKKMDLSGVGANVSDISKESQKTINKVFSEATIELPDSPARKAHGKEGMHSEHMGFILSDLQYMQRAYPNMEW